MASRQKVAVLPLLSASCILSFTPVWLFIAAQLDSNQVHSSQLKSTQVNSSQLNSSQLKSKSLSPCLIFLTNEYVSACRRGVISVARILFMEQIVAPVEFRPVWVFQAPARVLLLEQILAPIEFTVVWLFSTQEHNNESELPAHGWGVWVRK